MDMLERLSSQIDSQTLATLGGALGLEAGQAQRIGQAVLPAHVSAMQQQAGTETGGRQLLDLIGRLPQEGAQAPLDTPEGLEQVRRSGTELLPQLLGGGLDEAVGQVASQTGAERGSVLGMMQMTLPLVLGLVGQQVAAQKLGAGGLGALFSGLPASGRPAATPSTPPVRAPVPAVGSAERSGAAPVPGMAGDGMATVGPGAGLNGGVVHTNPALGGSRGLGWLWLLPLLLLLLLGGCFLVAGTPAAPFTLTTPSDGAPVTGAFAIKGTGTAGREVSVTENGQPISQVTVAEDGTFSAEVPAPSGGDHTYALAEAGTTERLNLKVVAAAPAASGGAPATTGGFAIAAPAADARLPAGPFGLSGTGKPGDVLEIFEDEVSLGQVTVGSDGAWTLNVPSPAAGAHTYTVKDPGGPELGSVRATVAAATASAGACTQTFSLSIPDGQTVAQPFRFGGVGSGKSYTVTISRGDRKIGSKVLPLDGSCSYSYTSKPGKGTVTYSVAPSGSAEVARKITLTVQ